MGDSLMDGSGCKLGLLAGWRAASHNHARALAS